MRTLGGGEDTSVDGEGSLGGEGVGTGRGAGRGFGAFGGDWVASLGHAGGE